MQVFAEEVHESIDVGKFWQRQTASAALNSLNIFFCCFLDYVKKYWLVVAVFVKIVNCNLQFFGEIRIFVCNEMF